MSAYFIVFCEKPADDAVMDQYRELAIPTIMSRNVKFHSRPGCEIKVLEGDDVEFVVMMEFESVAKAEEWYHSEEYQKALKLRLGTAVSRALIVERLPM